MIKENYGRAKETHAHTQALWEKEIRRARKETFKTQSSIVKLQEELKSSRSAAKMTDENLKREKERSKVREQEAFTARYQIVGVQEQLDQALERIKVVEQERDAYKTAAKNEEVARIAAEGRIPLPQADNSDDEFASPKKTRESRGPRVSLSTMDIVSSEASEAEIEELSYQLQWERQRAQRALEMVDFLQAECQLQCCPCSKAKSASRPKRRSSIGLQGPNDKVLKLDEEAKAAKQRAPPPLRIEEHEPEPRSENGHEQDLKTEQAPVHVLPKSKKGPRRSTIFCPKEGIFRTVSEQEAAIVEAQHKMDAGPEIEAEKETNVENNAEVKAKIEVKVEGGDEVLTPTIESENHPEPSIEVIAEDDAETEPPTPNAYEAEVNARRYARTPSVDPPAFAMLAQERTSLLSLLNAPHGDGRLEAHSAPLPSIPTVPDEDDGAETIIASPETRPHTVADFYTVTTTTTVPVHDDAARHSSSLNERLRTPSHSSTSGVDFDFSNPALTPTMTREQALAKIRERRGRARSIAQGTMTPRRRMVEGVDRRDMSAPTGKVASKGR